MRFVDPPTLDSPMRGSPGDDIDGLLRSFFRSEMPDPWPAVTVPEEAPTVLRRPMPAHSSLFRSRLALAASVALLLVGPWMLSGSFKELNTPPDTTELEATNIKVNWGIVRTKEGGAAVKVWAEKQSDNAKPPDKKFMDDVNEQLPKP
jgi:hypothetical protein